MTKLINICNKFFNSFLFSSFFQRLIAIALAFVLLIAGGQISLAQTTNQVTISGTFIVNWGDSRANTGTEVLSITDKVGKTTNLNIDPKVLDAAGGSADLNRKTVTITGKPAVVTQVGTDPALRVDSVVIDGKNPANFQRQVVSGSKPYLNILCQFPDQDVNTTFPQYASQYNISHFNGLMSANYPGMSHYWNEASYGLVNLNGTSALGPFNLPYPRVHYVPNGGSADLDALFDDCTHIVDNFVDYHNYFGINMAFNAELDGYAWGGGRYATLDGVSKPWPATWEPPWSWANQTVYAHEMGHSFGLPHSKFNGGNPPYNNYWDVMSYTWDCSRLTDPTYGCLGQQTNMYHKDFLGWIPANQKFTYTGTAPQTITLEQSDLPVTGNYKMASIPYGPNNGYSYVIEARRRVGYDTKLMTNAVIIHQNDGGRKEWSWVQGTDGAAGAEWLPGETFTDAANNISIRVEAATASGFQITINPAPPNMPTNLVANSSGENQITLNWADVAGESGYKIERSTDNTNWSQIGTTGANVTTYTDTNLTIGTPYYYRVWAYNITGDSAHAGPVNATTSLYAPGGLYALATSATQINLSWTDVSQVNDSYVVERATSQAGPFGTSFTINNPTANTYTDTTVPAVPSGTTYYYRVKATKAGGLNSAFSSVVRATPGNVLVVSVPTDDGTGATANTLSWAFNQATLLANSNAIINITVVGVLTVNGNLPPVPAGVTISGGCGGSGPTVTIRGSSNLTGLRFNTGNYSLFGLKIQGFVNPQIGPINQSAIPKYVTKCVVIKNQ